MFFPFRQCLECVQGPSFTATPSYAQLRDDARSIKLSTSHMGPDVVLLKNCTRICGTGGALATAPIVQNKAYFQVDITQAGTWGIGLGHRSIELGLLPIDEFAWTLRSSGELWGNGSLIGKTDTPLNEGDTITVTFDHAELKFYRNNEPIPIAITSVRGQVFPLVYVAENAILDVKFRNTTCQVPAGFEEIMLEQTLL
ncbi:unnamed protein product [Bursaphelenchus okinawaensis]|uniref:SPRY domain-containing protein 7 n=1 Tax=Bursaphelenchus okinawaensis TaxID=465554 RepID=A0A811LUD6_9BILA|nr:unnamed protein product [Bursaphelenchus okinawaensis]CAG9128222.1 unnamed protein product [Bursaphelenchus okinawaensis]